jgi:putative peptidoglycan lipid II flippase
MNLRSLEWLRRASPQLRLAICLAVLAASGIALNILYQWYVLTRIGPGRQTDALFAGMMVPQLALTIVSGSLGYVIVPLFSTEGDGDRGRLGWTLFQGFAVFWGLLAAVLMLLAPLWVPLTVPGFDQSATQLTIRLSRIQLAALPLTALAGVEAAAYQSRHRFLTAEASSVAAGLLGLGFIVWALPRFGIIAAAWAMVLRGCCQVALQIPALGPYRAPRRHPALREAWNRMLPLVSGASYYKADGFVDRLLASLAPPGSLSLYHLSLQLYASAHLVLNRAVAAPAFPVLARLAAAGEWGGFARVCYRRLRVMLWVTLGLLPVLVLAGRPLLTLVLAHGQFSPDRIHELWWILLLLGGVWVAGAAGQVLATSFYARGDTRTPTRIGVIGFTIAIVLKLVAFSRFGLPGLAVAASGYYLLNAAALTLALRSALRRVARGGEASLVRA